MTKQHTANIKRIATYGRVSTSGQEDEQTIRTQLSAVKEYAMERGYEIVREYTDEGWSGIMLERPALDQLRIDAKKRPWDAVLIYDPDRLARRYYYQELVIDELRQAGIETLFVTVPPVQNDEDDLMFGVRGVFAQYERKKIAERFRLGKVRKAKEGNIVASEAPYGYTLAIRRGKRGDAGFCETHYEINEEESRVVRMIFTWLADEGLTLRKIVKRLQEMGIQPRWSERGVWNTSTLSTLARNKSYIGEGHYGASYAVVPENPWKKGPYKKVKKSSRKMRPIEEWITVAVPAILEGKEGISLFARAQEQLRRNFEMSQRNKKNQYLVAGQIRCVCGRSRAGEGSQRGKYRYYRCTSRVHSYPLPSTCTQKGVNAAIADELIWSELFRLMTSPDLISKQIQTWLEKQSEKILRPSMGVMPQEKDIRNLKEEEARYTKAYGEGVITLDTLKEFIAPIRQRVAMLNRQIVEAERADNQHHALQLPEPHEIEAFTEEYTKMLQGLNFEEKRAIVRHAISGVIGTQSESGGQLHVNGSIAIKNHVEFFTSDRDSWPTECR